MAPGIWVRRFPSLNKTFSIFKHEIQLENDSTQHEAALEHPRDGEGDQESEEDEHDVVHGECGRNTSHNLDCWRYQHRHPATKPEKTHTFSHKIPLSGFRRKTRLTYQTPIRRRCTRRTPLPCSYPGWWKASAVSCKPVATNNEYVF